MAEYEFGDLLTAILDVTTKAPPAALAGAVRDVLTRIDGVDEVRLWVADMAFDHVDDIADGTRMSIDDSAVGETMETGRVVHDRSSILVPLGTGDMVVGVIELDLAIGGLPWSDEDLRRVGVVVADRLLATRGHSDLIARSRGAHHLGLAATIQHELLPTPSYHGPRTEVGGKIEPAYDIAGDAFDYAVADDHVDFAVFDAVGHGLRSAVLASCIVASYRLHRRRGETLEDIAGGIGSAAREIARYGEFVTGILCRLNPSTGELLVLNAGHPPPFLVSGTRVTDVRPRTRLPFGLGGARFPTARLELEWGDAIYLFSDGVLEARSPSGGWYGRAELSRSLSTPGSSSVLARCRAVLRTVVAHVAGPLRDDATLMGVRRAAEEPTAASPAAS